MNVVARTFARHLLIAPKTFRAALAGLLLVLIPISIGSPSNAEVGETSVVANIVPISGDDSASSALPIGFTFPFYGTNFTQMYLSTNGIMTFNGPDASYANSSLNSSGSNNAIFAFWDDLWAQTNSIRYATIGTAPNRKLVAQWTNSGFCCNTPLQLGTFQIILYESTGRVAIQYRDIFGTDREAGSSATVGTKKDSSTYSQYLANTGGFATSDRISQGQAIGFTPNGSGGYTMDTAAEYDSILLQPTGAPESPILVNPADGSSGVTTSPVFEWNAANAATSYKLYISTTPTFSAGTVLASNGSAGSAPITLGNVTSYTFPSSLAQNTTYYWRVGSVNSTTETLSSTRIFATSVPNTVPDSPSLITGAYKDGNSISQNQQRDSGISFNITDADSGQLVRYRIQISTDSTYSATGLLIDFRGASAEQGTQSFVLGTESGVYIEGTSATELGTGNYFVRIRAEDTASASSSWVSLGSPSFSIAPATPVIATHPTSLTNQTSAAFTFTGASGSTIYECQIDDGTWSTCSSSKTFTNLSDGSHTLNVRLNADGALSPSATYSWSIDATPPSSTPTISSTTPTLTNQHDASFVLSGAEGTETYVCRVDSLEGAFVACESAFTLRNLVHGSHSLQVRLVDELGNQGPISETFSWSIDANAPEPPVVSSNSLTRDSTPAIEFSGEEGLPFECQIDGGTSFLCESPYQFTNLFDGDYVLSIRQTDTVGNVGQWNDFSFTVDTIAPDAPTFAQYPTAIRTTSQLLTINGIADGDTVRCSINNGDWFECGSQLSLTELGEGQHNVRAQITDAAGNVSAEGIAAWAVDWTAPTGAPTVTSGPAGISGDTSPSFVLSGGNGDDTYECSVDNAETFFTCSETPTIDGFGAGNHSLRARIVDAAGNAGPISEPYEWFIDLTNPDAPLASGASLTNDTTPSFTFAGEDGATFECRINGGEARSCTSPYSIPATADGVHNFEVRQIDVAGNYSAWSSEVGFQIDATAPTAPALSSIQSPTKNTTASFTLTGLEEGARYECALDQGNWSECNTPVEFLDELSEGPHEFTVRMIDAAGNVSEVASTSWTIDVTPPGEVFFVTTPASLSSTTSPSFEFSSAGADHFECSLENKTSISNCSASKSYSGLSDGDHVLWVRGVDDVGNRTGWNSFSWTIDATAPSAAPIISLRPDANTLSKNATFAFSLSDAYSFDCSLDNGSWTGCSSPVSFSNLSLSSHTLRIRPIDRAGNVGSNYASATWRVESLPDVAPQISSGKIPSQVDANPISSGLGPIDKATAEALIALGVVNPPAGVPERTMVSNMSSNSASVELLVRESITVTAGTAVGLEVTPPLDVPRGTIGHAYLQTPDGDWFDLGERLIIPGQKLSVDPVLLTKPGNYVIALTIPRTGGSNLLPTRIRSIADGISDPITRFANGSVTPQWGNQTVQVNVGVTGSIGLVDPNATPTPTPTPTPSETPTPTPTPTPEPVVEPEPEPQEAPLPPEGERGEPINPAEDAPEQVAETAVTAVTLVSAVGAAASAAAAVGAAAGAAAGAASAASGAAGAAGSAGSAGGSSGGASGGARGGSTGGSSSGGSGGSGGGSSSRSGGGSSSSGSTSSGGASGGDGGSGSDEDQGEGSVANLDFDLEGHEDFSIAWGDALPIWNKTTIRILDEPSHDATIKVAPYSPLISKLINDGAYLRAMTGSISLILPALAMILGAVGLTQVAGVLVPPPAVILGAIAVIGIFDAFAGFLGITLFIAGISISAGVQSAADVRMLAGLTVIAFGPALLAGAFRGLRRPAAKASTEIWERIVDLAVAPFIGGWAIKGMVEALPALAGVQLGISAQSGKIGLAVAIAIALRIGFEELASQVFPQRLDKVHPTDIGGPSNRQKTIALTLRALVFLFVAMAFIGNVWQLYVGTLLFIVPSFLGLYADRLPNFPLLYQILPAGLPGLAFSLWIASGSVSLLTMILGATPDLAKMAFVLLPIPSLILSLLGMLGREPADGDTRWYQRDNMVVVYRVGGLVILYISLKLSGVI